MLALEESLSMQVSNVSVLVEWLSQGSLAKGLISQHKTVLLLFFSELLF